MCRCSGHCCVGFPVNMDSNDHIQMAAKLSMWAKTYMASARGWFSDEMRYIADMIIPVKEVVEPDGEGERHYTRFNCKYFNSETRDCLAYDQRPTMCSRFPQYGDETKKCDIDGCTYNECGCLTKVAE